MIFNKSYIIIKNIFIFNIILYIIFHKLGCVILIIIFTTIIIHIKIILIICVCCIILLLIIKINRIILG
jgi:hypothetical protein